MIPVCSIEAIGRTLSISTSVLGLTVIALGNSVGDLVADCATAREISPKMAVASCFGSPLLNDILGVGVATTIYTASHGPLDSPLNAQDRVAYFFLLTSLCASACLFPLAGFFDVALELPPARADDDDDDADEGGGSKRPLPRTARSLYPYFLFALYAAFMVVSVLVELDLIPQAAICALGAKTVCLKTSS